MMQQTFTLALLLALTLYVSGIPLNSCAYSTDCARDEICSADENKCHCMPGLLLQVLGDENYSCVPELQTTEKSCTKNTSCLQPEFECIQGKCIGCILGKYDSSAQSAPKCKVTVKMRCKKYLRDGAILSDCVDPEQNNSVLCHPTLDRCVCNQEKNYYLNQTSLTCTRFLTYGEKCDGQITQCGHPNSSDSSKLECSLETGRCGCPNEKTQTYVATSKKCKSLIGGSCKFSSDCAGIHTKCDGIHKKCVCPYKYYFEVDGICHSNYYYDRCNSSQITPEQAAGLKYQRIKCMNEQFFCESPLNQIFNEDSNKCENRHGAECRPSDGSVCTPGATCIELAGNSNKFECKCIKGFSPTEEGRCALGYGANCGNDLHSCNVYAGLLCHNGTCQCLQPDVQFIEEDGECLSSEGKTCGNINIQGIPNIDSLEVNCQKGLECVKNRFMRSRCQKVPSTKN